MGITITKDLINASCEKEPFFDFQLLFVSKEWYKAVKLTKTYKNRVNEVINYHITNLFITQKIKKTLFNTFCVYYKVLGKNNEEIKMLNIYSNMFYNEFFGSQILISKTKDMICDHLNFFPKVKTYRALVYKHHLLKAIERGLYLKRVKNDAKYCKIILTNKNIHQNSTQF